MEQYPTRKIYYFLLLATVVLAGVYVYDTYFKKTKVLPPNPQNVVDTQAIDSGLINPLYIQTKKITQSNKYTTIDIEYPEFTNIDIKENRKMYDFYMNFIADHNTISKENLQARFDTTPENKGKNFDSLVISEDDKFPAYGGYTVSQANDTFVSVLFSYGAFQGGAHGFQNLKTFNYDVKQKKSMSLVDILNLKNNTITDPYGFISEESRKQLLKKFAPEIEYKKSIDELEYDRDQYGFIIESIYEGTAPISDNFNVYTFTPEILTIYFGQYQVASYVDGEQQVTIPLK